MHLVNHQGEIFKFHIEGKQLDEKKKSIDWWFRGWIVISENGKIRKTNLKLLTQEDLFLLKKWIEDIYSGNYEHTIFQFVDGHVWFRLWKRGKERFIRFFIQGDKYRKFCWDWRINLDENSELIRYVEILNFTVKHKTQ